MVCVSVGSLWEPGGIVLASWVKGVRSGRRGAVEPLLSLLIGIASRFWVTKRKDSEFEFHGIRIIRLTYRLDECFLFESFIRAQQLRTAIPGFYMRACIGAASLNAARSLILY